MTRRPDGAYMTTIYIIYKLLGKWHVRTLYSFFIRLKINKWSVEAIQAVLLSQLFNFHWIDFCITQLKTLNVCKFKIKFNNLYMFKSGLHNDKALEPIYSNMAIRSH
jgi:hypothetical protein